MHRSVATVALVAATLHAGCSALLDFDEFQSANDDASTPYDGGPLDVGASDGAVPTEDAAARDGGPDPARPDGGAPIPDGGAPIPDACEDGLDEGVDIPLGVQSDVTDLPSTFVLAAYGNADGDVGLAWVRTGGIGYVRSWRVDVETPVAIDTVPETMAVRPVLDASGSLSLTYDGTDWLVIGRNTGEGDRAARCDREGCTEFPLLSGIEAPFAFAVRGAEVTLVHAGVVTGGTTMWHASSFPAQTASLPLTAAGRLSGVAAAATGSSGLVVLASMRQGASDQAAFAWRAEPEGPVHVARSNLDLVGMPYVAYDAATETAIGVVQVSAGGPRTHIITATHRDLVPTTRLSWVGNAGPVVSRGDGTFLVSTPNQYELLSTSDTSRSLGYVDKPSPISHPLVVGGRYAVLYVATTYPYEIRLRVYSCLSERA